VAAFQPRVLSRLPRGDQHLQYHWDGRRIDRYFDYQADRWTDLRPPERWGSSPIPK
jgi:hypothetical protein